MTTAAAPATHRYLQAVADQPGPGGQLIDALTRWAVCPRTGDAGACLQVSDGELTADFCLDGAQAAELARILEDIASRRSTRTVRT